MAPGGRDLDRFSRFLRFWEGLVIYSSYQVLTTTCLKSFLFLCIYPDKVFSACAEVWSGTWPSTAPIMAPGGRDLGKFSRFLRFWERLVICSSYQVKQNQLCIIGGRNRNIFVELSGKANHST